MVELCPACGAGTVEGAIFCHRCGRRLSTVHGQLDEAEPAAVAGGPPLADVSESGDANAEVVSFDEPAEPEEMLWSGTYSHRAVIAAWLVAGAATLTIGALCMLFAELLEALFIMLVCAVVSLGGVGLYLFHRRLNARYALTSRQFVQRMCIPTQVTCRIDVAMIDDIVFSQGPIERVVGVGTIMVTLSGDVDMELLLRGIANAEEIASRIDMARRAERRRRGWYINDE